MKNTIVTRVIMAILAIAVAVVVGIAVLRVQVVNIPVLRQPLTAGTVITADRIGEIQWPVVSITDSMITDRDALVGRTAIVAIRGNEPMYASMVVDPADAAALPDPSLAEYDLNKSQVFVPTDLRRSSGGVVAKNDYVNVMILPDPRGESEPPRFILQKIHVAGVRSCAGTDAGTSSKKPEEMTKQDLPCGYVLLLTPEQQELLYAYAPERINLIPVKPTDPDLDGVSTGLERYGPTAGGPAASPDPDASPAPSGEPTTPDTTDPDAAIDVELADGWEEVSIDAVQDGSFAETVEDTEANAPLLGYLDATDDVKYVAVDSASLESDEGTRFMGAERPAAVQDMSLTAWEESAMRELGEMPGVTGAIESEAISTPMGGGSRIEVGFGEDQQLLVYLMATPHGNYVVSFFVPSSDAVAEDAVAAMIESFRTVAN